MKINQNELRALYRAHVLENMPESRKNCLSLEDIIHSFQENCGKRKKRKVIDHISNCSPCFQEFEFVLDIMRKQSTLITEIGEQVASAQASQIIRARGQVKRRLFSRPKWRYSFMLGGFIIFISMIFIVLKFIPLKAPTINHRGEIRPRVILIAPLKARAVNIPLIFKWQPFKNSQYYVLEIFDETLVAVWKSPEIPANQLILPEDISTRLLKHRIYYWLVTSQTSEGKRVESDMGQFRLTD